MYHAWLVPLLPALSFAVISLLTKQWKWLSATISIGAMVSGFIIAAFIAVGVLQHPGLINHPLVYSLRWLSMPGFKVDAGILLDPLSAMMLFMVTLVASLIQIYSLGYMRGEKGFSVFFAYMSLFGASMLLLVAASNLLELFVAWEGVGVCSYMLIGFYNHKISAREAAKKAFVTTRIGDTGLLLGLLSLQLIFGTLNIADLAQKIPQFQNIPLLITVAVLFFLGPVGKSGQFPLHVWLPDAMEGPTPVSALIHAATMVVAGVYLVGRMLFMFASVPPVMELVAWVGGFTAIFAASIAITQREIKRILAYSTISQIGYMMLGLGVGSLSAGFFHLWTHAFFKALMFLGAGSVLIGLHHKADVWEMGGLIKKMPITAVTFVVGGLAISGIPPFAGFWSKGDILDATLASGHTVLFVIGSFTAFLTAFYIWRMIFLCFFGKENPENHPQESPLVMTIPLMILALFSTVAGLIGTPWWDVWGRYIHFGTYVPPVANWPLMIGDTLLGALGIYAAYLFYCKDREKTKALAARQWFGGRLYDVLYHKYYLDELYMWFNHSMVDGVARLMYLFDIYVVDGIVNGVGAFTVAAGEGLRVFQTGRLQNYALVFFLGVLAVGVLLAFTGPHATLFLGGVR